MTLNNLIIDLTPNNILYATKRNLYDFFDYLRQWDNCDFYETPALQRWWTPVPYPWFNGVLSLQPPAADESARIGEMLAYFKAKGNQVITWWLTPELESSDWGRQLEQNGLNCTNDTPGMAVELQALNVNIPYPDDLEIRIIEDDASMVQWASIFTAGYGLPVDWTPTMLDWGRALGMEFPMQCYLASIAGEPMASSLVFYGAGVAGIYNVATLPAWRGKGIGAAVTLQPLLDARRMGYRLGVLQTSEMGYKVYQRLGFKEVCKMSHYYWTKG